MIHSAEKFLSISKPVRTDKLSASEIQGGIATGQTLCSKRENWEEKRSHGL